MTFFADSFRSHGSSSGPRDLSRTFKRIRRQKCIQCFGKRRGKLSDNVLSVLNPLSSTPKPAKFESRQTSENHFDGYNVQASTSKNDSSESSFKLSGNTLKSSFDSLEVCHSQDRYDSAQQNSSNEEQAREDAKLDEIPQNQLGLNTSDWDFQSVLMGDISTDLDNKVFSLNSLMPPCENANAGHQDDSLLDYLSGRFRCSDSHDNQVGFLRCPECNPKSYKNYQF